MEEKKPERKEKKRKEKKENKFTISCRLKKKNRRGKIQSHLLGFKSLEQLANC